MEIETEKREKKGEKQIKKQHIRRKCTNESDLASEGRSAHRIELCVCDVQENPFKMSVQALEN